jgi:hypothetical protein
MKRRGFLKGLLGGSAGLLAVQNSDVLKVENKPKRINKPTITTSKHYAYDPSTVCATVAVYTTGSVCVPKEVCFSILDTKKSI